MVSAAPHRGKDERERKKVEPTNQPLRASAQSQAIPSRSPLDLTEVYHQPALDLHNERTLPAKGPKGKRNVVINHPGWISSQKGLIYSRLNKPRHTRGVKHQTPGMELSAERHAVTSDNANRDLKVFVIAKSRYKRVPNRGSAKAPMSLPSNSNG